MCGRGRPDRAGIAHGRSCSRYFRAAIPQGENKEFNRKERKGRKEDVGATGWSPRMPQPKREFNRRERKVRKEDFSMCSMRSMWLKDDLTTENSKAAKSLCSMRSLRLTK
jgi:hypothetical protein